MVVGSGRCLLPLNYIENLVDALTKTKQFKEVLRSGDRNIDSLSDLLILKTTVEAYTPGSETRRAVTTLSGATKLRVRSQLCTRDGNVVLETLVDGNVRFFGAGARAIRALRSCLERSAGSAESGS